MELDDLQSFTQIKKAFYEPIEALSANPFSEQVPTMVIQLVNRRNDISTLRFYSAGCEKFSLG